MGMVSEFKEFALKGNMIDMAVGIIIGAATGKVVSALVDSCLLYTSPSPRDLSTSRMPSSA